MTESQDEDQKVSALLGQLVGCVIGVAQHAAVVAKALAVDVGGDHETWPYSRMERLVRAAEKFASAKKDEADALAALARATARQATVDEAEGARRAERHALELVSLRARVESEARYAALRQAAGESPKPVSP